MNKERKDKSVSERVLFSCELAWYKIGNNSEGEEGFLDELLGRLKKSCATWYTMADDAEA